MHSSSSKSHAVLPAAMFVGFVVWSCASPEAALGELDPSWFGSSEDAAALDAAADSDAALFVRMCVETTCPTPYITCPSEDEPSYVCGVDPRRDDKHCGGCGRACGDVPAWRHARSRCVESSCRLECYFANFPPFPRRDYHNCNQIADDGCESDILSDPDNCGNCGHACAETEKCIDGRCGCPPGLTECEGNCVDLRTDDANCGRCGNACSDLPGACEVANAAYRCQDGTCGHLVCNEHYGDCDGDLERKCASNGCETMLPYNREHCGSCGNACPPEEVCMGPMDATQCRPKCEASELKNCQDIFCADTLNDPQNCGGCGHICGGAQAHQAAPDCKQGVCAYRCVEGWADCNANPVDGCETNLRVDPAHCGVCDNSCDLAQGQPCIEGTCLERPCQPAEAK